MTTANKAYNQTPYNDAFVQLTKSLDEDLLQNTSPKCLQQLFNDICLANCKRAGAQYREIPLNRTLLATCIQSPQREQAQVEMLQKSLGASSIKMGPENLEVIARFIVQNRGQTSAEHTPREGFPYPMMWVNGQCFVLVRHTADEPIKRGFRISDEGEVEPCIIKVQPVSERAQIEAQIHEQVSVKRTVLDCYGSFINSTHVYLFLKQGLGNLRGHIESNPQLTTQERTFHAIACAQAVKDIHAEGVVHRDIKQDNFIIFGDGRIQLSDFGSVGARQFAGSPVYIAPELFVRPELNQKSDIWSLGCVILECFGVDRSAFPWRPTATDPQECAAQVERYFENPPNDFIAPLLTKIPPPLHSLIRSTFALDPDARPTAGQVSEALIQFHTGTTLRPSATAHIPSSTESPEASD